MLVAAAQRRSDVDSVLAATLIRRRTSPRHGGWQRPYNDRSTCMRISGVRTGGTGTAGLRACESRRQGHSREDVKVGWWRQRSGASDITFGARGLTWRPWQLPGTDGDS